MIRITALNEELDDEESDGEGEGGVTREALEEIALQQYARTLELQKKGNLKDALQLLRDLLDTELLYTVGKPEGKEHVSRPLLNLKYLCYRNIASVSAQLGDSEAAVEAYLEASSYDPTDITLWYRLGTISLRLEKFDLALYAFQRGVNCNAKHWLCLDKLVTILLGLGEYNHCIFTIYSALELDPDYLRGRAYRKHIFEEYPYVQRFLSSMNPIYKWTPEVDEDIKGKECQQLLLEAKVINEAYTKKVFENRVSERLPILTLNKPIENWSWFSLGESLVDMHMHISENLLSHACVVKVSQPEVKSSNGDRVDEPMEVDCTDIKQKDVAETTQADDKVFIERLQDEKSDKTGNESDKPDIELDSTQVQDLNKSSNEGKDNKKAVTRRRGSSLSFLEQWEWCTKRRSSRKKTTNRQDQNETIYDTLKRILPQHLLTDVNRHERTKVKDFKGDDSLDTMDLYKLFEEKEKNSENALQEESKSDMEGAYFNSEKEQADVQEFIQKYADSTCDIITMLDDYVETLSKLWETIWPEGLGDIYMEANWCSRQHSDPPLGYNKSEEVLKTFININLIHLETGINKLLEDEDEKRGNVETELIDLLKILCSRRESLGESAFSLTIRFLWVKCHSLLYKDQVEYALDCLYYLIYELNCLDEEGTAFTLKVPNFTKWPLITKSNCIELIKSLERNKQLSTVSHLYELCKYEEVIVILQDSFKYCQHQASKQEWESMALDWAVQLVTLLESLWALGNTEECFMWAAVCLHEALKQYMLCEQGNDTYDKWSLTVTKVVMCLEHILKREGSAYLDILPEKAMARLVQDVIQTIVHQLDDSNTSQEMQVNTPASWILLHYIFQREEDCGRMKKKNIQDEQDTDIPSSLMILFIAHENLGKRGWCGINDGQLLYFILKTVIPRLRSPALFPVVETVSQYLEQCVYCLFGHPTKKTRLRYLIDHGVTPTKLDWEWAQKIFDLYRPEEMPEFNSYRLGSITAETEQLFLGMLASAPPGLDPHPHCGDVIAYIEGRKTKLPDVNIELPYKMREIYYLLADFYLKNNETFKALKYYGYDIVISKNRFDSWAGMALARGSLLETKLNSCETFKTEMEYLTRATAVEGCFKKALEIDCSHSMLWIEYGAFVYGVHSFCSRMLKQASESLSMDSFEVLESRKEAMLDKAHRCFINAHRQWMAECQTDDKGPQDERWLHYYMLGKISEKKNEQPQKYLDYYQKASKFLQENNATYPTKINYNNPQNLSVEALEIHYRINASILKYIEQHENKVIYAAAGKSFKDCLDLSAVGPFGLKKKTAKDTNTEKDQNNESSPVSENTVTEVSKDNQSTALKRTHSEDEEDASKKVKLSHSGKDMSNAESDPVQKYDIGLTMVKGENQTDNTQSQIANAPADILTVDEKSHSQVLTETDGKSVFLEVKSSLNGEDHESIKVGENEKPTTSEIVERKNDSVDVVTVVENITVLENTSVVENIAAVENKTSNPAKDVDNETRRTSQESASNTATSKENSSSSSSSDSSSEDSSSDSSSSSSDDSGDEKKTPAEMTQEQICDIIAICLENLEDCVNRFPQHYKALYRLAHFHFYYKRDRNVSRCRDLMLGSFTGRNGVKLQGLFCERKNSNFFNGIWRIPASEVDRPGSFASHMSRCVLITMEVLKEIDDNKTLLDLSLQLQRTPDAEKKYLRDSERIELSQQALSLCIRSIKGQLGKFSKQSDLSKNVLGRKELSNLMLEVYRSYQRIQKHAPTKVQIFSGLLVDAYKIYSGKSESENLLEKSIKKCQSIISTMKQRAQAANNLIAVSQIATPSLQAAPPPPPPPPVVIPPPKKSKPIVPIIPATSFLPHLDQPAFPSYSYLPYLPMMDNSLLSDFGKFDHAAAALYMSNMRGLGGLTGVPNPGYQADFLRQIIANTAYMQQGKSTYSQSSVAKPKSSAVPPKSNVAKSNVQSSKAPPSSNVKPQTATKSSPSSQNFVSYTTSQQHQTLPKKTSQNPLKISTTSLPSTPPVSSVQQSLYSTSQSCAQPAHSTPVSPVPCTASGGVALPAHQTATSTVSAALHTKPPAPHQQVSPGKTLQEKLAERQKQNPSVSKSSAEINSRAVGAAAFSGKIPSSLVITKTAAAGKGPIVSESLMKNSREAKKSIQFGGQMEKLAQPTKLIDSSEVIVLDDD